MTDTTNTITTPPTDYETKKEYIKKKNKEQLRSNKPGKI
jgi:hypothetical protein